MGGLVSGLGLTMARAIASMGRRRLHTGVTIIAVACALWFASLVLWCSDNLLRGADAWHHEADMVVVLERDTDRDRALAIESALGGVAAIEEARWIGADVAYRELERELGSEILEGVDAAVLPAIIEVRFSPGIRDVALAHPIIDRLETMAEVTRVEVAEQRLHDLEKIAHGIRAASSLAMVLALALCFALVFASMTLAAQKALADARVYRLFGGAECMVERPLIATGLIVGLVGGLIAVLALFVLHSAVGPQLAELFASSFGSQVTIAFLSNARIALLLGVGVIAGWSGTVLAVRNHGHG